MQNIATTHLLGNSNVLINSLSIINLPKERWQHFIIITPFPTLFHHSQQTKEMAFGAVKSG
jgi:hypothetical protein